VSDAVFSAEYARELVEYATRGATFVSWCSDSEHGDCFDGPNEMPDPAHHWEPRATIVGNHASGEYETGRDIDGAHWRYWYRETFAAYMFCDAFIDFIGEPHPNRESYVDAWHALDDLRSRFTANIDALGAWWGV